MRECARVVAAELSTAEEVGLHHCPYCNRELAHWYAIAKVDSWGWVCAICQSRLLAKVLNGADVAPAACEDCGCKTRKGQALCYSCAYARQYRESRVKSHAELEARGAALLDGMHRFNENNPDTSLAEIHDDIDRRLGQFAARVFLSLVSRTESLEQVVVVSYPEIAKDWELGCDLSARGGSRLLSRYTDAVKELLRAGVLLRAGKHGSTNGYRWPE